MKDGENLKIYNPDGLESDNPFQFIPVADEPRFQPMRLFSIVFTQLCYWVGCLFVGLYLGKLLVYFSGVANVDFSPW